MARNERAILANSRAMEEEDARMTMRGSGRASAYGGRMIGAGATPSMGLSQFRGGAMEAPKRRRGRPRKQPPPMMEDDEDMEGGFLGAIASAAARSAAAASRQAASRAAAAARTATRSATQRAALTAAQSRPLLTTAQRAAASGNLPRAVVAPRTTLGQIQSSVGKTLTAVRRDAPSIASALAATTAQRAAVGATRGVRAATAAAKKAAANPLSTLGTVANVAIPAYMLADYLRSKQEVEGLDAGYFDDYIPEDAAVPEPEYVPPMMSPVDTGASGPYAGEPAPDYIEEEEPVDEVEVRASEMGLTRSEYIRYLRTGNLPVARGNIRVGAGELMIRHGGMSRRVPQIERPMFGDVESEIRERERVTTPVRTMPVRKLPTPVRPAPPRLNPFTGRPAKPAVKQPVSGRRRERAELVKQVMRERGVKLGEASRIVKEEGLF